MFLLLCPVQRKFLQAKQLRHCLDELPELGYYVRIYSSGIMTAKWIFKGGLFAYKGRLEFRTWEFQGCATSAVANGLISMKKIRQVCKAENRMRHERLVTLGWFEITICDRCGWNIKINERFPLLDKFASAHYKTK